jgi:hypothetical protein
VTGPGSNAPRVTGDEVRDTLFWPPQQGAGYDAREVDDLVRRVAAELDAGRPAGPVIENAVLRRRIWGERYDIDAVDWFLGQLLLPPGRVELAGIAVDPWGDLAMARLDLGGVNGLARFCAPGGGVRGRDPDAATRPVECCTNSRVGRQEVAEQLLVITGRAGAAVSPGQAGLPARLFTGAMGPLRARSRIPQVPTQPPAWQRRCEQASRYARAGCGSRTDARVP